MGVVAFTCNPATLKVEYKNSVSSIPVGGNSPSVATWIVAQGDERGMLSGKLCGIPYIHLFLTTVNFMLPK